MSCANTLNAAGYRTTGNRGPNLFTKDTVRPMLQSRFYLGELPDGNGGWLPGKHAPMLDSALAHATQRAAILAQAVGGSGTPDPARR